MGQLKIIGYAKKDVKCDEAQIRVQFKAEADNTKDAVLKIMKQCDSFLETLTKAGVALENINIEDDMIRQNKKDGILDRNSIKEKSRFTTASRRIGITIPFNASFVNDILEMLGSEKYNVSYDLDFDIKDADKIRNQLLKDAIEDSKNKADYIAKLMNQKITGIDKLMIGKGFNDSIFKEDDSFFNDHYEDEPIQIPDFLLKRSGSFNGAAPRQSDSIGSPDRRLSEEVEIIWNLE